MRTAYHMIISAVLLLSSASANCQPTQTNKNKGSIYQKVDSLVNSHYKNKTFSGSVLVADNGKVIINKDYGYSDLDSLMKINSESVYEIASLSKQFTALLIMKLNKEGKLNYDDPVTKYLPQFPYKNITIRHLLTHTSGLSEKDFFKWARLNMDPSKIYSNEFILNYLETEKPKLSFSPGEKWEYSNLGYFLLPLIIKQSSRMNYISALDKSIFEPLKMNHSGIYSQKVKGEMKNYVRGKIFNPKDSTFRSSFGMAWSDSIYGGVGIISNTTDLLKWDISLYTNKLVNQTIIDEAFEPYKLLNDSSSGYGFGWFVKENTIVKGIDCGKRVGHYGIWPGYESSIVRYIDRKKTIIILSNQSPSTKDRLIIEISEILFQGG